MTAEKDSFLWLEDLESEKSSQWVKMQNETTQKDLEKDSRFIPLKERIKSQLSASDKLDRVSFSDTHVYRFRTTPDHEIGLWERSTIDSYLCERSDWNLLLNFDSLFRSSGKKWYLGHFHECWENSDLLLVSLSEEGRDACIVREFDVKSKSFLENGFTVPEGKGLVTWLNQNSIFLSHTSLCKQTKAGYPNEARVLNRGQSISESTLVYSAPENTTMLYAYSLSVGKSKVPLVSVSQTFWDFEYYSFDKLLRPTKIQIPSRKSILYGEFFNHWIFLAKEDFDFSGMRIKTGSVFAVSIATRETPPRVLFVPSETQSVESISLTKQNILIVGTEQIRGKVWIVGDLDGKIAALPLPGENLTVSLTDDHPNGTLLTIEGHLTPPSRYHFDSSKSLRLIQQTPHRFDSSNLTVIQKFVTHPDGTSVPYFVIYPQDIVFDGNNPTILYGYGGFETSLTPSYMIANGIGWLEKNYVYVVANIRGGGEFGPKWHQAAMLENKQRSYDDFILVAEDLIRSKMTSPRRLGISGGSNGGLLVGSVTLQRPELFNAALSANPLLDMIRYPKLSAGALWVGEYGDPEDPAMRDIILKYSPYQNIVSSKKYPKMFIATSLSDDRVHPGHARKFAAKMQSLGHDTYFYEDQEGGHNQGTPESMATTLARKITYFYQQLVD